MHEPCTQSCPMHYNNPEHRNCMRIYRNLHGNPDLNLHQYAKLLNVSEHGVRAHLFKIFNKIRREALAQELRFNKINSFQYFHGARVCACCGILINRQFANPALLHNGLEWCSRECQNVKPAWILDAEQRYGTDILTVLSYSYKMFKKLSVICLLLDVRKKHLLNYYYEHFRIPPSSFGLEAIDTVDILRNPSPGNTWDYGALQAKKITNPVLRKLLARCEKLVRSL